MTFSDQSGLRRRSSLTPGARLRNALMRILGPDAVARVWWRLRGRETDHFRGDLKQRFSFMYDTGFWVGGDSSGPLSGWGSSVESTKALRDELPALLREIRATSLIDIGCGDFTWMKLIDLPCSYVGIDIVPSVIEHNAQQFARADRSFAVTDACSEPVPTADVALCREVLFHLSFADSLRLMANVSASGARYLLATTNPHVALNLDIPSGEHSDRNLELAPLNLGPPDRTLWDGAVAKDRVLGLWKLH